MIEITNERGHAEWRAAHRGRITVSDAPAFMAKTGSKRRQKLVDRLVLDREGVEQHTDEQPEPWAVRHEADIVAAVQAYRQTTQAKLQTCGMIAHSTSTWLVCSPHALLDGGVLWTRTRETSRVFHVERGKLRTVDRVRAQLMAWICEREWCDVCDVWVPGMGFPNRVHIVREALNVPWVCEIVLPRLAAVWRDVAAQLKNRRDAFNRAPIC
jgi:hypothetical protein